MQRVTVRMVHERKAWRLATYDARWLTPDGPLGNSGAPRSELCRRMVFRNPRPRYWRYRGPNTRSSPPAAEVAHLTVLGTALNDSPRPLPS